MAGLTILGIEFTPAADLGVVDAPLGQCAKYRIGLLLLRVFGVGFNRRPDR